MNRISHHTDLFQNIFEASAEGTIAVNDDGKILMANPACEQLFGYKSGELAEKNIDTLIPENLKKEYKSYLKKGITSPRRDTNIWGMKKDGSKFSLNIGLSPTWIDSKSATIVFFRDATEHTEALKTIEKTNEKLLESNRKFDALINNQKGIVFRCKNNQDYEMEFISEGCWDITGYSFEDFTKNSINYGVLILKEDRTRSWQKIQKEVKQKKSYSAEYRIKHKNGNIKHVWERGEAVYNDQNEVVALEGFISDITSQKEIELELLRSQTKIKALLEAIPDVMLIQDRDGVYMDWYASSPEKLLMPPEEFIGGNMKKLLPPSVYQKIKSSHNKVMESGEMQITEYSVQSEKGMRHFEARVVLMHDENLLTIVRNTTKRKFTDAQLNIRNNALTSASNSIVIADAQQKHTPIIYCNKAFEKMTGYSQEEVIGRNCHFLQNHDRDQKEIGLMKNAIVNGENCNVIVRNYRKDGSLFWNDVTITPIYNKDNKLTHFIGVQNDITQKVMEEKLKDQTTKTLEFITENKPLETIANTIIETLETHLENCTASILLLSKPDKTLHELAAPNVPKEFSLYFEGAAIGPQECSFGTASFLKKEIIVSNIESNMLWENHKDIALKNGIKACWSFPITSSTHQVLGILNVLSSYPRKPLNTEKEIILNLTHLASIAIENNNNIRTLKENKQELEKYAKELEEKVQQRTQEVMATVQKLVETNLNLEDQLLITEQAQKNALASKVLTSQIAKYFPRGLIVVIDKDLKVQFVEGEALDQLDIRQEIYEGLPIDDLTLFSKPRRALIKENVLKTLAGEHLSFEIKFKKSYFSINTAPLFDENNEIVSALHVYNNISSQKEIEFTIQSALKKEIYLNELKSRFVSMASHEFRTPLSAILTSAILIGKQNGKGKEQKREKYLTQIEKNVNHLVVILNDFLSLSKLEEGKVVANREQFDLIKFCEALAKENNIILKQGQSITVSNSIQTLYVNLDTKLMRHVLMNLLSNASKYSPEGSNIDLKISKSQEKVSIQVKDQGIGIPEDEHTHMFQRFYRARNAENVEGTGLGLNIVKNYTKLMDGDIGFKSQLNKGSTFWVEFPINKL